MTICDVVSCFNHYPAKFIYLNFQPLEFVFRYRDPQLQVVENYLYLFNLRTNIYKCWFWRLKSIPTLWEEIICKGRRPIT